MYQPLPCLHVKLFYLNRSWPSGHFRKSPTHLFCIGQEPEPIGPRLKFRLLEGESSARPSPVVDGMPDHEFVFHLVHSMVDPKR